MRCKTIQDFIRRNIYTYFELKLASIQVSDVYLELSAETYRANRVESFRDRTEVSHLQHILGEAKVGYVGEGEEACFR